MLMVLIVVGFVLLIAGAEILVRGASQLALAVGMPPLIIGLTVVAFGTSAPELAVSLKASLSGQPDIALGNVLGSNVANVLLILGLSAMIAPVAASSQLVRLDVPVMIAASGAMWWMAADGVIGRFDGLLLVVGLMAYLAFLVRVGRRKSISDVSLDESQPSEPGKPRRLMPAVVMLVVGLVMLVFGARWLVQGAVDLARLLGVSELLIGVTVVAAGTSMPELATSAVASLRGERDIAVGNVVGSNIFNIVTVLGISAVVAPQGVGVADAALRFDVPVMVAVAVVCLPIFFTGGRISRGEGLLLFAYYLAYLAFLVLSATGGAALDTFTSAMIWFVMPLTALGITFSVVRPGRSAA